MQDLCQSCDALHCHAISVDLLLLLHSTSSVNVKLCFVSILVCSICWLGFTPVVIISSFFLPFSTILRMLKEKGIDGTYLIRGGSHAGAEKVLSVWHVDRCRHYRLFKDEVHHRSTVQ